MTYQFISNPGHTGSDTYWGDGTLRTTDDRVPQEYREICCEEFIYTQGGRVAEHYCLSLYYPFFNLRSEVVNPDSPKEVVRISGSSSEVPPKHAEVSSVKPIEIEFTKEADMEKFKTRLAKAFVIRYEDSPEIKIWKGDVEDLDFDEEDDFIGWNIWPRLIYDLELITYADKMEVRRITIFDIVNQARKLIIEFKTRRDRTNFINILEKTSGVRLLGNPNLLMDRVGAARFLPL
jgi:hypothetical protein